MSFTPTHIQVDQNMASTKTSLILNSNSILSLPSALFIHPTVHSYQHPRSTPTQSRVCVHPPTLLEIVCISQVQPREHQCSRLWPPLRKSISPSACAGWDLSIYCHQGMTDTAYLQEQSRVNKVTSKYARCQALCLQREQSNLKASVVIAHSGSGSFKGKGGWKGE